MAYQLPASFSIKSKHNNKYLRYTNGDDNSSNGGLLKYSGKILISPFTKFTVERSEIDKGLGLVHIKSCYNNKYWVRLSENSNYIAAISNERDEDKSKWSCTLFRTFFVPEQNAYYFLHVQLNMFLRIARSDPAPYTDCLSATSEDITNIDESNLVVDWESIFILPKYSAFKSDNGKFLVPLEKNLQFLAPDVEHIDVTFEIASVEDEYISIRHGDSNKYWIRGSNNCVQAETIVDYDSKSLFWPINIENKFVGLRNKANIHLCMRNTFEQYVDILSATTLNLNNSMTRFQVKDVAVSKKIQDLEYNVNAARVYGKKILNVYYGLAVNNTEEVRQLSNRVDYQKEVRRTWSSTVSKIIGVTTEFTAKVPIIENDGFSFLNRDGNIWDKLVIEKSFEDIMEMTVVPPMTTFKCVAQVTQAYYDVPFSYNRVDTLQHGFQVTNRYEDGIFTGFMTYDYQFTATKFS